MWKIARPRRGRPRNPADQVVAFESAVRGPHPEQQEENPPAYMLPNSRSECDSGFDTLLDQIDRKFAGQSNGFVRMARRQLVDPASRPLAAMANPIIKNHTRALAERVLTSAVGTARKPWGAK